MTFRLTPLNMQSFNSTAKVYHHDENILFTERLMLVSLEKNGR